MADPKALSLWFPRSQKAGLPSPIISDFHKKWLPVAVHHILP